MSDVADPFAMLAAADDAVFESTMRKLDAASAEISRVMAAAGTLRESGLPPAQVTEKLRALLKELNAALSGITDEGDV